MKKKLVVCAIIFCCFGLHAQGLRNSFLAPDETIQTSVYWYWISDNISKEGVVKDLRAMKKAGINRAFIGNIGLDDVPYGKIKLFSDQWWEIIHTALKTATELNIEIGIFNSPGWSQSGGPWVKPGQAMRYLASSTLTVQGPILIRKTLEKPAGDFQDVKVIAFPASNNTGDYVDFINPKLTASGRESIANFSLTTDVTVRSIVLWPAGPINAIAELQAKQNGTYKTIKEFSADRRNSSIQVGWQPFGPIVISIPETNARDFRIVFKDATDWEVEIMKVRLSAEPLVERYIEKTLAKMYPDPHPLWDQYQWPQQPSVSASQVVNPKAVKDISAYMDKNGLLVWTVPSGKWIIQRIGMLPTGVKNAPASPEGQGLEADKMSKTHIRSHFDAFVGEMLKRIPAADRKSWKMVVQDSYEMGGENWTDDMLQKFKARYHYDPLPYLPVMNGTVIGSRDQSDRFLWDLRRLIADRIAYDYVGGLTELCHNNGLRTWLENYGHSGFPGEFLQYGGQADEVSGEFWSEGELGDIENRAASSAAHIYGKTKVSSESFTAGGQSYGRFPYMMKKRGDRFFTQGINNTLLHVYIQQPDERRPGINAWFGNEFNRHNTWFEYMDMFTAYLKRCNLMLQQGKYVADIACFIGEDAPKMTGIVQYPLPPGYSFDYINAEVLLTRAKVTKSRLVLPDGMSYGLLVLPPLKTMRPELLRKVMGFIKKGLHILGPLPERSPSLEAYPLADKSVATMSKSLEGNANIIKDTLMQSALYKLGIKPDFLSDADSVLFIHRRLPGKEIYFICNQSNAALSFSPAFRVSGKKPELWDPVDGAIRSLPQYITKNEETIVPLKLEAMQGLFVVFSNPVSISDHRSTQKNFPQPTLLTAITTPWTVTFDTAMRGPVRPQIFNQPIDWSKSTNDSIKYYSGTAVYCNTFVNNINTETEKLYLCLGKLNGMAKVKMNGMELGGIWTSPWKLDITKAVKLGENKVEISVVNNWMNRLIGDSRLPPEQRKTFTLYNRYTPQTPLQESGLTEQLTIERVMF